MGWARFTELQRSSMRKRGYQLCDRGHMSRKSSIRRGSYLSYDLGVMPKNERGKKGGEEREEEREGGEGRDREVCGLLCSWQPLFSLRKFGKPLPAVQLAEHGFLGKEVNHRKITQGHLDHRCLRLKTVGYMSVYQSPFNRMVKF